MTINGTTTAETDIYIIRADLNNIIKNVGGKKVTLKAFNSNFTLYGQVTSGRYIQATKDLTDAETEIVNSFIRIPANTVCNNLKVYPQIEIAEGTDYEEHKEQKVILDIQQEMLTGDYFDLDRKKEAHTWNKKTFNGTEVFIKAKEGFYITLNSAKIKAQTYCEYLKNCSTATELYNVEYGTGFLYNSVKQLYIKIKGIETVEELKSFLAEMYNAGTPIEIYYQAEETTKLDLTEAQIQQLEQLNKLRFYKNVNNIFTLEDIALLQADYEVDLQKLKGIPGPKRRQRRYRCERRYRSNWSKRR